MPFVFHSLCITILLSGCTPTKEPSRQSAEKILEELNQSSTVPSSANNAATNTKSADAIPLPIPGDGKGAGASPKKSDSESDEKILGSDVVVKEKKIPSIALDDPSSEWGRELRLPYQVWEMTFVGNAPAGYSTRRVFEPNGRDANLKLELESTLHVQKSGKLLRQRLEVKTTELTNGKLIEIAASLVSGAMKREFNASLRDGVLTVDATIDGVVSRTEIPFADDVRGPFAVEQSLFRKPLRPGEIRSLRFFDPMMGKVVETQLEGLEFSKSTTMLGESLEMLEVEVSLRDSGRVAKSKLWMGEDGRVIKTHFPELNLRVFQVNEKLVNDFSKTSELQFIPSLECPLELNANSETFSMALKDNDTINYRVSHSTEDPSSIVSKRTNQRVRSVPTARTCEVSIFRVKKDKDLPSGIEGEITSMRAAKQSSEWCDIESQASMDLHTALTKDFSETSSGNEDFLKVEHLRQGVFQKYEGAEFDREVRKFHQIVRAKKLDPLEHALLLTAMCRKSGIPARVAIGMVYNQNELQPTMKLHAWVEFYVKDRWYAADSSQSSARAELDRIKIRESYAENDLLLEEVLVVARWIGNAKVRFLP